LDQALTTLRIVWRRRALFFRPLVLPLAFMALFAMLRPILALVVIFEALPPVLVHALSVLLQPGQYVPFAEEVLIHTAAVVPFTASSAVGVAVIVHVVVERAAARRWLPSAAALRLAAVMTASMLCVYAFLLSVALSVLRSLLSPQHLLMLLLFLQRLDWLLVFTPVPAIFGARRFFPAAAPIARPTAGRLAATMAVVLVMVSAFVVAVSAPAAVLLVIGDVGLLPVIALVGGVPLTLVGWAIMLTFIGVSIAIAAFTAAQPQGGAGVSAPSPATTEHEAPS
jgi:hypothetical protein